MKNSIKLIMVLLAISIASGNVYAKKDKDKDKDKNGVSHRVTALEEKVETLEGSDTETKGRLDDLEASDGDTKSRLGDLEALGEYLLTSSPIGAADCLLTIEVDTGFGFPGFGFAKDSSPPSISEPYFGDLTTYLHGPGCDPGDFAPAGAPTDIVAVSRGACTFGTKAANAATAGYGAMLVYNLGDPFNYEGQITVRMFQGGAPFPIPSIMINARDGFDLFNFLDANGPRPMVLGANGPAQFCSPLND